MGPSLRQFWMDILQEKPVGPPSGSASLKKAFKVYYDMNDMRPLFNLAKADN